jgi:hypothetical protein
MTYNVMTSGRSQVIIDQQQLVNLQEELARRGVDLERLKGTLESLAAVNEPEKFMAAAMAACNQLASRFKAERVALGFLKGRYVRVRALSHTEKITRQMQLVQDIEGSMEECLDQDVEILYPPVPNSAYVARATEKLSQKHGPSAVISLPLRRAGEPVAVLTMERKADQPFKLDEIETLRLIGDLLTARLVDLHEHDRWFGAKLARGLRNGFAAILGPKHTWLKVAALLVLGFVLFCTFVNGAYRVDATVTLEVVERQIISAPYDSLLDTVNVEPGDVVASEKTAKVLQTLDDLCGPFHPLASVIPPTTLATLDTNDRLFERNSIYQEQMSLEKEAEIRTGEGKPGEARIAELQARAKRTRVEALDREIRLGRLVSPLDGVVQVGDFKGKRGMQVRRGDGLYEVAPLVRLRAKLLVPEDEIAEVKLNMPVVVATNSYPGVEINGQVTRINPMATVISNKNVFEVRATLDKTEPWMMPGMEGGAKISIGQAKWGWLLTHRVTKWAQMKLWW